MCLVEPHRNVPGTGEHRNVPGRATVYDENLLLAPETTL